MADKDPWDTSVDPWESGTDPWETITVSGGTEDAPKESDIYGSDKLRAATSFGNDPGMAKLLKSLGYVEVKRNKAGDMIAKDSSGGWHKDAANFSDHPINWTEAHLGGALPLISGTAAGTFGLAGGPASIPAAIVGAMGGEGLRQAAGRHMGVYDAGTLESAKDTAVEGFNSGFAQAAQPGISSEIVQPVQRLLKPVTEPAKKWATKNIAKISEALGGMPAAVNERFITRPTQMEFNSAPGSAARAATQGKLELQAVNEEAKQASIAARDAAKAKHGSTEEDTSDAIAYITRVLQEKGPDADGFGRLTPLGAKRLNKFIGKGLTTKKVSPEPMPGAASVKPVVDRENTVVLQPEHSYTYPASQTSIWDRGNPVVVQPEVQEFDLLNSHYDSLAPNRTPGPAYYDTSKNFGKPSFSVENISPPGSEGTISMSKPGSASFELTPNYKWSEPVITPEVAATPRLGVKFSPERKVVTEPAVEMNPLNYESAMPNRTFEQLMAFRDRLGEMIKDWGRSKLAGAPAPKSATRQSIKGLYGAVTDIIHNRSPELTAADAKMVAHAADMKLLRPLENDAANETFVNTLLTRNKTRRGEALQRRLPNSSENMFDAAANKEYESRTNLRNFGNIGRRAGMLIGGSMLNDYGAKRKNPYVQALGIGLAVGTSPRLNKWALTNISKIPGAADALVRMGEYGAIRGATSPWTLRDKEQK